MLHWEQMKPPWKEKQREDGIGHSRVGSGKKTGGLKLFEPLYPAVAKLALEIAWVNIFVYFPLS